MSKIFFRIFLFLVFVFTLLLSINIFYNAPLFSSIDGDSELRYLKNLIIPKKEQKVVYGFLPYWNLDEFTMDQEITNLAYFGLDIKDTGEIATKDRDGNIEPGYRTLESEEFLDLIETVKAQDAKVELVLKQFDNDDIEAFLDSSYAQDTLLKNLDSLLLAYPISGVNIDIEYSGDKSLELKDKFTNFIGKFSSYINRKYQNIQLSVDVYASAASKEEVIWDIPAIEPYLDYIIVMAYDFHQRSSTQAGPVAPLFGENEDWDKNINQNLKLFLDKAPRKKILLGVPFYGYGWQTESTQPKANTYKGTGFTVSYKKAKELLEMAKSGETEEKTWQGATEIKKNFDNDTLSPYITYQQDGEFYTIYYEDPKSITYKLEYARQLDLAGIAIWALGYEDNNRELWQAVAEGI